MQVRFLPGASITDLVPEPIRPSRRAWTAAIAVTLAVAVALTLAAPTRPGFDPYGWLTWGHMTWHGGLDTNAAPSWKPLPYLFTLPESLLGGAAVRVWTITAVAAGLAAVALAGRLAYRLAGTGARVPRAARWGAALLAALGVLCLHDESAAWSHYALSAYSDPMIVACVLGAIDARLSGRPRTAFWLLVLASLGRPEAWPFLLAAAYAARRHRWHVVAGLSAVGLLWFGVPALTARSAFVAFDNALGFVGAPPSHPVGTVLSRFVALAPWPLELAAAGLAMWGAVRRDRTVLALGAAALGWMAIEAGFALHGLPGLGRYMFEPAAVVVVLGAVAAGRLASAPRAALTLTAAIAVVTVVLAVGQGRHEARDLTAQRARTAQVDALRGVVDRLGGPARVRACGEAISRKLGDQTLLAWTVGENVSAIGYRFPQRGHPHNPVLLFTPRGRSWAVRALRQRAPGCRGIASGAARGSVAPAQRSGRSG
jgi:hypothetical protein